jgi:hypothetical protein
MTMKGRILAMEKAAPRGYTKHEELEITSPLAPQEFLRWAMDSLSRSTVPQPPAEDGGRKYRYQLAVYEPPEP